MRRTKRGGTSLGSSLLAWPRWASFCPSGRSGSAAGSALGACFGGNPHRSRPRPAPCVPPPAGVLEGGERRTPVSANAPPVLGESTAVRQPPAAADARKELTVRGVVLGVLITL